MTASLTKTKRGNHRVPLLEDVITPGGPASRPAGKNGSRNHSLAPRREPEPEPERTTDSDITVDKPLEMEPSSEPGPTTGSDIAAGESAEIEPASEPAVDDAGPSDQVKKEIGKGVKLDPYIREWLLENARSMSGTESKGIDRQSVLRAGAELMVDNLVKEYSQEIVKRLRKELSSLLDELNIDEDKPGDA